MIRIKRFFKKTEEEIPAMEPAPEQQPIYAGEEPVGLRFRGAWQKINWKWKIAARAAVLLILVGAGVSYVHVGSTYKLLSTTERKDISGTKYAEFGKYLLKYSSDGVTCLDKKGAVRWNSTFTMQSPIIDICGNTVVIADQKGTQIFVYNKSGTLGQYQTLLPIEKVRVAKQGVVAAVLSDGDASWINFYDTQGNEIAKNKTTINDSGYPLDVDVSPDGMKIMISYLCATEGSVNTNISFYNFDEVGQAEINNLVNTTSYNNVVAPKVFFSNTSNAVAYRTNGFSVFQGREIPEVEDEVTFEEEVLTVFEDDEHMGFIFKSDDVEHKFRMELYDTGGNKQAEEYIDMNYKEIKIREDNIIMFNDKEIAVYGTNGKKEFHGKYKKPIIDVLSVPGYHKYMILTQDSTDMIRLG